MQVGSDTLGVETPRLRVVQVCKDVPSERYSCPDPPDCVRSSRHIAPLNRQGCLPIDAYSRPPDGPRILINLLSTIILLFFTHFSSRLFSASRRNAERFRAPGGIPLK